MRKIWISPVCERALYRHFTSLQSKAGARRGHGCGLACVCFNLLGGGYAGSERNTLTGQPSFEFLKAETFPPPATCFWAPYWRRWRRGKIGMKVCVPEWRMTFLQQRPAQPSSRRPFARSTILMIYMATRLWFP